MIREFGDPILFRRRFVRQVLVPIACIILATLLLGGIGLFWGTRQMDAISAARQTQGVTRALGMTVDALAYQQQTSAVSGSLARKLRDGKPDTAWLDENVGSWLNHMFGHQHIFILDAADKPIYAMVEGHGVPPEQFEPMRATVRPLVDGARGRGTRPVGAHDRHQDRGLSADATVITARDTIHDTGVIQLNGRPAAVSAMRIAIPAVPGRHAETTDFVMITARYLDGPALKRLGERTMIEGLRYSRSPERMPGERRVGLVSDSGAIIGHFFWHPVLPGMHNLRYFGPITLAIVVGMIAAMLFLARSLWISGRQLGAVLLELKASEEQANHLALHDVLTGLPNRALLDDRLEQALGRSARGEKLALLALDLDRFKEINDTLGHHAGDDIMRQFAARLLRATRPMDTVARMGGDEFTVLLGAIEGEADVDLFCGRLLDVMAEPFDLSGRQMVMGVSIGVAMAPENAATSSELMRQADIALYRAKADGRGRYRRFEPAMDEAVRLRRRLEDDLRTALGGDHLHVHYQPQVDAKTRRIVGLEALARWRHPNGRLVCPDQFIPVAEETGMIHALGDWVLTESCRVAKDWPGLYVAVNLSPLQFRSSDLAERIIAIVGRCGCTPDHIQLEITERVLLEDDALCHATLDTLRAAGFAIVLDDFGTGYSSLNYLRRFRVNKIKIDKSFTQSARGDAAAIISSVVTLGHAMGLTVTAEGVETEGQAKFLTDAGCDEMQGHLFALPVAEKKLRLLLRDRIQATQAA